jgi:cytoskeletal protein CcmA (bactofilin family)
MKKLLFSASLGVLLAAAPLAAQAAEFAAADPDSGTLTIRQAETRHNLYAAAGDMTMDGTINGDLYVVAGDLVVGGSVEQDAVLAGGTVYLNGKVGGDARIAAGTVIISAPVAGDVVVFGGTVTLGEKAEIGGDLIVGGGTVTVNGPVAGQTRINGGSVTINSALSGPLIVQADDKLVFGPQARVPSAINYKGERKPVVEEGAQLGAINQEVPPARNFRGAMSGLLTVAFLIKVLAYIAAGLVLLQFFRRRTALAVDLVYRSPWLNLGMGFIAAVAIPVAVFILALIGIGYYIAILLGLFYLLALALAVLLAAIFLGAVVIKWLTKKPHLELDWQAVAIGVVGFILIALIPFVGWVIDGVLVLMVFGALIRMTRDEMKGEKNLAIISE